MRGPCHSTMPCSGPPSRARRVTSSRPLGRPVLCRFATALEATRAALEAQRAVQSESWSGASCCECRCPAAGNRGSADGDYLSHPHSRDPPLEVGHGGQSALPACGELAGPAPPRVRVCETWASTPEGLGRPERIAQLVAPTCRPFPPLNLPGPPATLPAPRTPLLAGTERSRRSVTACAVKTWRW